VVVVVVVARWKVGMKLEVGGRREVERGLRAFLLAGHKKEPKEQNDNRAPTARV
jgi:hypothetical protein